MLYFQGTDNKLWRTNPDGSAGVNLGEYQTKSTPIAFGNYIYFQGTDDKLWRINLDGTGGVDLGGYKTSSPVFATVNNLFFRGTDNKLWKINLDGTGGVNLGGYASDSSPFVALGYVFFQGTDNTLWRINLDGSFGIKLGNYKTQSSPFVAGTYVYFRGTDDKLWRINQDGSGGVNLGGYKTSSTPYVTLQHVYFQGTDNKLWQINLDGGGGVNLGGYKCKSSPTVDTSLNFVYFQGTDNALWRLNLDGSHGVHLGGFNCSSTPFAVQPANQPQTGTSRLSYILLTVVYAPPGTNGGKSSSTVKYSSGSATGATSTFSSSLKGSINAGLTFGSGKNGQGSFGVSAATQTKDTSSFATKKTVNYEIDVAGPGTDGINHDEDLFYLWLNPQLTITADPWNNSTWELGSPAGQNMTIQYARARDLKNPATMNAQVLQDFTAAGMTTSDFASILSADPFAFGPAAIDPNRFLLTTQSFPYDPPDTPTDSVPVSPYTQTNTVTNTITHEATHTYSVSAGFSVPLTDLVGLKVGGSLTLTDTETTVSVNESTQSATVTVGGPALGYNGPVDVQVYWDTLYNSFMFAFASAAPSFTDVFKDAQGQPVAHQEVALTAGGHTFKTFTNAKGQFRFFGTPAGAKVSAVTAVANPKQSVFTKAAIANFRKV